jgi:proteasome lid subunit RPN8/RPN11
VVSPGPAQASLPATIIQLLIDHARTEYPNEACGVIVGDRPAADGGVALRWAPTRNEAASPYRYRVHPDDLLRLTIETDDADEVFWAIVHSHVRSPAVPSPTDLGAAQYPDALYILVSLSEDEADPATGAPSVRAWRILDGEMTEVELLVTS